MYKPNQRQVRIDILAGPGWVTGTLHVPGRTSLLACFNKEQEFLALTQVPLDSSEPPMDFLALRRSAVRIVIPDASDIDDHASFQPGSFDQARLRCILGDATVEGTIDILTGQRVSDFLETSRGFILLSDCSVTSDGGAAQEHVPHVIVNAAHLLAVADLTHRDHAPLMLAHAGAEGRRR